MNKLRLGFSETSLLFFYYLDTLNIDNTNYKNDQSSIINWLYSTSGFYDKKITGSYFDFDSDQVKKSDTYKLYFNELLVFVKECPINIELCFIKIDDSLLIYKEKFLEYINYNNKNSGTNIFEFMNNKNILVINNFGSLIKKQFDSGNMKMIHNDFSDNIKSIQYFNNGYTFLNNGPDDSIL